MTAVKRFAELGIRRALRRFPAGDKGSPDRPVEELIAAYDVHIGTPDEVIASLRADTTLARVTDITVQVHSVDPPHPFILRSLELVAEKVAPALGWQRGDGLGQRAEKRVAVVG